MITNGGDKVSIIGFCSSIAAALLNSVFLVFAILERVGAIHNFFELHGLSFKMFQMFPSIFLAPTFIIAIVSLNNRIEESKKIWTQLAIPFATIYAVMVAIVYFVTMTIVIPEQLSGTNNMVEPLIYEFGSFLYAINVLGYGFMSLSTLFLSFTFLENRKAKTFLFLNGILFIIIPMQMMYPGLLYVSALQGLTFPLSMIFVGFSFKSNKL